MILCQLSFYPNTPQYMVNYHMFEICTHYMQIIVSRNNIFLPLEVVEIWEAEHPGVAPVVLEGQR